MYRDCAEAYPDPVLVATAEPDEALVGRGFAVPLALDQPHRGALPADGWAGAVPLVVARPHRGRGGPPRLDVLLDP